MTIETTMELLKCSRAKVYRLKKSGKLASALKKAAPKERDVIINKYYESAAPSSKLEEPAPIQESFTPRELSPIEQKELQDRKFAADYLAGKATDSHGNRIGSISVEPRRRQRVSCASHMNPALCGGSDGQPRPWDDEVRERWHPGAAAAREKMYRDSGQRQPSEQERKVALDISAIRAAFNQGYSR